MADFNDAYNTFRNLMKFSTVKVQISVAKGAPKATVRIFEAIFLLMDGRSVNESVDLSFK